MASRGPDRLVESQQDSFHGTLASSSEEVVGDERAVDDDEEAAAVGPLLPTVSRARRALIMQEEILGIFSEINELAKQNKKQPGTVGKLSAVTEAFITDFIRGAWSPVVVGLMLNYDPTIWPQFISNVANLGNMLVYSGAVTGTVNAVLGQLKDYYSPASETPAFIQQLRDLNQRVLNEARALERLLSVSWDHLVTKETTFIPSQLAKIQEQLEIQPKRDYVSRSMPDSKMQTVYDVVQTIFSAANYTTSGVLLTKLGFDFFGKEIKLDGLDWRAGIGIGVAAILTTLGAGISVFRAQAEKRKLISTYDEVRLLIRNIESLMARCREWYEQLKEKFGLASIDYAALIARTARTTPIAPIAQTYGTSSETAVVNRSVIDDGFPSIEHVVTEMRERTTAISQFVWGHHGLFPVRRSTNPTPSLDQLPSRESSEYHY